MLCIATGIRNLYILLLYTNQLNNNNKYLCFRCLAKNNHIALEDDVNMRTADVIARLISRGFSDNERQILRGPLALNVLTKASKNLFIKALNSSHPHLLLYSPSDKQRP